MLLWFRRRWKQKASIVLVVTGALWLAGGCLHPLPVRNPSLSVVSYELAQYQSATGMRVTLEHTADTGLAGAVLVIGAGSADDGAERSGLAHLTEHLAFDAHASGGAPLWQRFETLGAGAYNGMTSWDSTTYFTFVPQENLPDLLSAIAGVLKDPLANVDDADFTLEKQIVKNETRTRSENGTTSQALGWLMEATFPAEHPYAHPSGGKPETLDRMTLADVRAFAAKHYTPNTATLIVQSPLPTSAQRALVERVFGDVHPASAPQRSPTNRALDWPASKLREYSAAVAAPVVWIGWSLPGIGVEPQGMGPLVDRLVRGAVLDGGYPRHHDISRIDTIYIPGIQASLLALEVSLKEGGDPEGAAHAAILHTIRQLNVLTHLGFEATRFTIASSVTYDDESLVARGLGLARAALYFGDATRERQRGADLLEVEESSLANYSAKYLTAERAHLVFVRPLSAAAALQQAQSAFDVHTAEQHHVEQWPAPNRAGLNTWMRRADFGYRKRTLANGLEVVVVPRAGAPFHTVLLGFHGGSSYGVSGAGEATLWSRLGYSAPSSQGLQSRSFLTPDSAMRQLRGVGRDLSTTLRVLRDSIMKFAVRWPPQSFVNQLARFEREEQLPAARLDRASREALLGTHAYGSETTAADMNRVSATDVHDWLANVERPENAELVIVGDFEPNGALRLAEEALGDWDDGHAVRASVSAPQALRESVLRGNHLIVEHAPSLSQAKVGLTCVLPASSAENWPAYDVFSSLLAARLFGVLKRQLGASYSVVGWVELLRGGTTLLHLSADVDPVRMRSAFHEIRKFVDHSANDFVDDASVEQARFDVGRHYNLGVETSAQAALRALLVWRLDWPLEAAAGYPERLLGVRRDQVVSIAEHCRANWVLSVLGDERSVRAAWAATESRL